MEKQPRLFHKRLIHRLHDQACEKYEESRMAQVDRDYREWERVISNLNESKDGGQSQTKLGKWPLKIAQKNPHQQRRLKKLPQTDLVTVAEWNGKGKITRQSISSVTIPEQERKPPMFSWIETPINYRVEDGEYLQSYPYLDGSIDIEFENELYNLYGEKDFLTSKNQTMSDEVFLNTVNNYEHALVIIQKKNHGEHPEELTRIVRKGVLIPCRTVFATMSEYFPFLGFPYQLEDRYATLCRNPSAAQKSKVAAEIFQGAPIPFSETVDADLNICNNLFCPRCLLYCCVTHEADDHVDPKYMEELSSEIICPHPDCIERPEKSSSQPEKINMDKSEVQWTPSEIAMCNLLFQTKKHKSCYISSIITTKTCRQIWKFLKSSSCNSSKNIKNSSASSNYVKVKGKNKEKDVCDKYVPVRYKESGDIPHYKPCSHGDNGACNAKNNCYCVEGGTYCERWCLCPLDCPRRFKGCNCRENCGTLSCPCYASHRECDPGLCLKCCSENKIPESRRCQNVGLLYNWEKPIDVKISTVVGWGGFIGCDAEKGELIVEYRGEIISDAESERRAIYYLKIRHTYLFTLNESFVVDGTRIGSKARFINSSKHPNCFARVMMVNSDHRIGIYAKRRILAGEELFFDYENIINKHDKEMETERPRKPSKGTKKNETRRRC